MRAFTVPRFISESDMPAIQRQVRGIPFIGKTVPRGYERVSVRHEFGEDYGTGTADGGYLLVDSSGFGTPREVAMTGPEFLKFVRQHPGYGYGIVEAGQFQVVIGVYRRTVRASTNTKAVADWLDPQGTLRDAGLLAVTE